MKAASQLASVSLELKRTFDDPIERVFDAWANETSIAQWLGPVDEMDTIVEAHDFRVGGEYRYRLITRVASDCNGPTGQHHVAGGTFLEIKTPTRLVFTWQWLENGMEMDETVVSLDFIGNDKQTELILLHEKLPGEEARDAHREGWEGCLDCLARFLQP